jgi:hypothetical protein
MNKLLALVAVVALAGCATTRGAHDDRVFAVTPEQGDRIVAAAMAAEFPGRPIARVAIPNPGYVVTLTFLLDHHTIAAYAVPAEYGVRFRVDSQGSMIVQGEARAAALHKRLLADAAAAERTVARVSP